MEGNLRDQIVPARIELHSPAWKAAFRAFRKKLAKRLKLLKAQSRLDVAQRW